MAAIGGVRVLPPEAPARQPAAPVVAAAPPERPTGPRGTGSADAGSAGAAPVDELALRRQRRLTRVLSLAVAAALVVALGLGAWVVDLTRREPPVAASTLETELLRAPDVKGYTISAERRRPGHLRGLQEPGPGAVLQRRPAGPGPGPDLPAVDAVGHAQLARADHAGRPGQRRVPSPRPGCAARCRRPVPWPSASSPPGGSAQPTDIRGGTDL